MKTLVIMESPAKAKKVQGYLGTDYIVKASVGHIREMPLPKDMSKTQKEKYGDMSIDISNNRFEPLFVNSKDKIKVIKDLKDTLGKCDELILFTDPDNEGHAISWHLLQVLKPTVPTYRATSNEITDKAVKEAFKNKKLIDEKQNLPEAMFASANSATTRAMWDRMYGFSTSPYVWRAIKPGTSSGRVQSPGARLVIEREEKRLAFKSINYYTITAPFDEVKGTLIEYKGQKIATSKDINDEGEITNGALLITDSNVKEILIELKKKSYIVEEVKSKPYKRSAPPPFTTSSALQSIGGKTGMGSKQITSIFQQLYQNGHITYIRTVSIEAAPDAIAAARKMIVSLYGKQYLHPTARVFKDKSSSNSGHECIRPVLDHGGNIVNPKLTDSKEQKVFDAIQKRMLASQGADCVGTTWTAIFSATDKEAKFSASETEIKELGWRKIYDDSNSEENEE